jgi:subtilisin-like proprotein convertase family protein
MQLTLFPTGILSSFAGFLNGLKLSGTATLRISSLFLFGFLALAAQVSGQAASATWALTSNGNAAVTGAVTASALSGGSGIGTISYGGANGVSSNNWNSGSRNLDDYYEYAVTPTAGNVFTVSGLEFQRRISGGSSCNVAVYYSLDNFTNSTQIGSNFTINTTLTLSTFTPSIVVNPGTTLRIRVYAWNSGQNNRAFNNRNVVISGTTCALPAAAGAITGAADVCVPETGVAYSVPAISGATSYVWTYTGTGFTASGATSSITANFSGAATDGNLTVAGSNACGTGTASAVFPIDVTASASPTAVLSGTTAICDGQSTNLSLAVTGTGTISGTLSPGAIPFSGTAPVITVSVSPSSLTTYTIATLVDDGCAADLADISGSATITVNPSPDVTASITSVTCMGEQIDFVGTSSIAGTYSWTGPGGFSASTLNASIPSASAANNGAYTFTSTVGSCSESAIVNVTVGSAIPVSINPASAVFCFGTDGVMLEAVDGQSTTPLATASGTVSVAIPQFPNAGGASHTLAVSGIPSTASITAIEVQFNLTTTSVDDYVINLTAPNGNTINLVNQPGGLTYLDNYVNTVISSSSTTPLSSSTATYTGVFAADGAMGIGATGFTSNQTSWCNLMSQPNGNWTISMLDLLPLDMGTLDNWTITLHYVNSIYSWSPSAGLAFDEGACVMASPTANTTYTVTATTAQGCVSVSSPVMVAVNRPMASITGTASICEGESTDLSIAVTGDAPFSGLLSPGNIPFNGNGPTIVVSVSPATSTTYSIASLSDEFCTAVSGDITGSAVVTVNPVPSAVVVTPASALICAGDDEVLVASGGLVPVRASAASGNISQTIPDVTAAGTTHTLAISGVPVTATIHTIVVNLNITHTFDDDLIINLRAPNGNVLNLAHREGGFGENYTNTTFSSAASVSVVGQPAPFTGTFLPEGALSVGATGQVSNVASFSNLMSVANGNWVLSVRDRALFDVGTLDNWSITLIYDEQQAFTWSPAAGLNTTTGATVTASPSSTTTYTVSAISAQGCSSSADVTVEVRRPQGMITAGTTTVCADSPSTTITLYVAGQGTINGTLSPGGIPFSGTAPQITVNVSPSSTTTYTIATLSDNLCNADPGSLSGSATITVTPQVTYYQDADGDGYGNSSVTLTSCSGIPNGYSVVGGDCDDNNADTNPGADEWLNGIDDNCNGLVDELVVGTTFYQDSDGDGFGNAAVTVVAWLMAPPGYVSDNTDCDDSSASRHPGATEICGNGIDDDCDGIVDEGCGPINDERDSALILFTSNVGACQNFTGTLAGATVSPETGVACTTGEDVWYYFTAPHAGASIRCTTTASNVLLELQDQVGNVITSENVNASTGDEVLNTATLVAGNTYFLRVRNFNSAQGSGPFTLCINHLRRSRYQSGAGPLSLCNTIKAEFVNANGYQFTITPTGGGTPMVATTTGGVSTQVLANIAGMLYTTSYDVTVDAVYNLTDGLGNPEVVLIPAGQTWSFSTGAHIATSLRAADACPNARTPNALVAAAQWACGATSYEFELTAVSPVAGSPAIVSNNGPNRYLNLMTAGVLPGYTYNVRIRPVFGVTPGSWGPLQCMQIMGTASTEADAEEMAALFAETESNASMNLFPNPVTADEFFIQLTGEGTEAIHGLVVRDLAGRTVNCTMTAQHGTVRVALPADAAAGLYLVTIHTAAGDMTRRMVVSK